MIPEEMTLRDWFAGQALIGILSNPDDGTALVCDAGKHVLAEASYRYADAMMEARNNER